MNASAVENQDSGLKSRVCLKKIPLNQRIYLTEYFKGNVSESFKEESDQRILYWDFDKALDEKVKVQIETLLNEIVRTIKNREDRRNRYLLPLKCLFCYAEKNSLKDIQKMEQNQEQEYYTMLKLEYEGLCPNPKRFIIFCRKVLFMESVEIDWQANVWFVERLNISQERYSRSNTIMVWMMKQIFFLS